MTLESFFRINLRSEDPSDAHRLFLFSNSKLITPLGHRKAYRPGDTRQFRGIVAWFPRSTRLAPDVPIRPKWYA
jgi:hypothetical protein